MNDTGLYASATEAIRYWEPRRLAYNAVLTAIVVVYFLLGLPASKAALSVDPILELFLFAVMANIGYCAAYIVDVFAQTSGFRDRWRNYRWVLFAIGVSFAGVVTRFFVIGILQAASR